MSTRRRRTWRVRRALGIVALACALFAPSAWASRAHSSSPSLVIGKTEAPAGERVKAGELELAAFQREQSGSGVAVNDSTKDIYVADTGNRRVDEFSAAGVFIRAWGWGVATGAPELQSCTTTCQRGLSGSEPGEFVNATYIAVDNDAFSPSHGDVYVGDMTTDLVTKFDPEGHLITTWGNNGKNGKGEPEPNGQLNGDSIERFNAGFAEQPLIGIAVDGSGELAVVDGTAKSFGFDYAGTSLSKCNMPDFAGPALGGITAVTGSTPRIVAIDGGEQTYEYELTLGEGKNCKKGGNVTVGQPRLPTGLASDDASGEVYVDKAGLLLEDIPATCVPNPAGCLPSQIFGEGTLTGGAGVAVDGSSGTIYVAEASADQIFSFPMVVETTIAPATAVSAHAATLRGTVNPVGSELTRCQFEYGTEGHFELHQACAQSNASIGSGDSPVSVDATVTGLVGQQNYSYRIRATNGNGNAYSEATSVKTSTTALVKEVKASHVTASSAVLEALVNPEGVSGTKYHFEYGICADLGKCAQSAYTNSVPSADLAISTSTSAQYVSQPIEGLTDGASYHFQIVVEDANGLSTPSPEGTFVFEPAPPACGANRPAAAAALADCRAYEMVTPTAKDGALIDNGGFLTQPSIAPDGSRVFSKSIQCFGEPESCIAIRQTEGTPFSFERGEDTWTTEPLAPSVSAGSTMLTYDAETDSVLYAIAGESSALEQLMARQPDGSLERIGPIGEQPGVAVANIASTVRVATASLSRVVYQGSGLWPSLEGSSGNTVFEYVGAGNSTPLLVGVTGAAGSTSLISACSTFLGAGGSTSVASAYGSLASDGRTVYFTASRCATGTGANAGVAVPALQLYARIEGAHGMSTVHVSAPGPASVCHAECQAQPPADASFQGASEDGSHVFFTSTQQLSDNASEDRRAGDSSSGNGCEGTPSSDTGCNLYEFVCSVPCENASERKLIDASAGDTSGLGPQVQGVVAIPSGGSDVYFLARGVLTDAANEFGRAAAPGVSNLYVYRSDVGGSSVVEFITSLSDADARALLGVGGGGIGAANVTPDGRYLVFTASGQLTPDARPGSGPAQVYRYDAQAKQLARLSIGQDGFNDNGNDAAANARIVPAKQSFFTGQGPGRADPTMSDDGRFVFFQSPTGLTPGALDNQSVTGNKQILAENVYEWEAPGAKPSPSAPACESPVGCISLISDGHDLSEGSGTHGNSSTVELLGSDASGSDVYFFTSDQLVPSDTDTQVDLYDARVDGGLPQPPVERECVTLTECHPTSTSPPLFGAPGSVTFNGPSNSAPSPSTRANTRSVKTLSRVQKRATALRACRKKRGKRRRVMCEQRVRKLYAPKKSTSGTRR